MKRHMVFACGARYPRTGSLKKPFHEMASEISGKVKPESDGRHRFLVSATRDCPDAPILQDGRNAPCSFGCPVSQKKSGRKRDRYFPPDGMDYREVGFDYRTSCLSSEVVEQ